MKSGVLSLALLVLVCNYGTGQTLVDLRSQSKSVDFSGATFTKPFKTGVTLPAACTAGESFFKTDAAPGSNLYLCTATNTWTAQSGSGISGSYAPIPATATVPFSTTPVFDLGSTGNIDRFEIALTGGTVSSTFANLRAGAKFSVAATQDSAGSRMMNWPAGTTNTCVVSGAPGVTTTQQFEVASDGVTVMGVGCTTNDAGVAILGPAASSCLGTVAAGALCAWFDSTTNTLKVKDPAGNIHAAVLGLSAALAHQVLAYVDSSGIQHTAQLASSDLSDSASLEKTANKGAPGGYAPLDAGARIPLAQIPTGQTSTTVAVGSDPRFSDARTPTAHASQHQNGGGDEVAVAAPSANAIPKAGVGGTLASGWIPTLNQNTTGNAATATALAASPSQCTAGQYSTGVAPSGNANCAQVAYSQLSGTPAIPVIAGTAALLKGNGSGNAVAAVSGTDYQAPGVSYSVGGGYLSGTRTVGATGVSADTLVKLDASGNVVTAAAGDTGILGIAASTAGPGAGVEVATRGVIQCLADNSTVAANLAGSGTVTGGRCKDLGQSAGTSVSVSVQVIGRWLEAVAAGSLGKVQLYGPGHYGAQVQAADLPNPGASSKGGVQSLDCTGTGHILKINTDGTATCSADSGGGGGIANMSTGAGAASSNCTAPSASNLSLYTDTTNQDIWACVATNTWKKVLSTNNSGPYVVVGTSGAAPSNPASGSVSCYFSSAANTQLCLDSNGNVYASVKAASSRTANQFVTYIDANGVQQTSSLAAADLPAMIGDSGSGGVKGAVPAPAAGDAAAGKFFRADGTWGVPPAGSGVGTSASGQVLANSSGAVVGVARSGNGNIASASGTLTNGHCVSIDGSGNFVDAGAACTTGGGGGTVSAGSSGQLAYYAATGTVVSGGNLTGDVTSAGLTATIAANAVNSAKMAVANIRRTCIIDNDTQSGTPLSAAQFSGGCIIPAAATLVEVDVWGGTGAIGGAIATTGSGSVNLQKYTPNGGATAAVLSANLATVAGQACANPAGTGACITGLTATGTISTAALAAGDWIRVSAANPDGAQTWYRIAVVYTIN